MLFNKFKKDWIKLSNENFFLKFLVVIQTISLIIFALLFFKKNEKIIVTPPIVTEKFVITENFVESQYKTQMALFFSNLIGNISKKNAGYVLEVAKKFFDTQTYALFRDQFTQLKQIVERNDYVMVFSPYKVIEDPKTGHYAVIGTKSVFSGDKKLSEEEVYYEIGFTFKNWTLSINFFELSNNRYSK